VVKTYKATLGHVISSYGRVGQVRSGCVTLGQLMPGL